MNVTQIRNTDKSFEISPDGTYVNVYETPENTRFMAMSFDGFQSYFGFDCRYDDQDLVDKIKIDNSNHIALTHYTIEDLDELSQRIAQIREQKQAEIMELQNQQNKLDAMISDLQVMQDTGLITDYDITGKKLVGTVDTNTIVVYVNGQKIDNHESTEELKYCADFDSCDQCPGGITSTLENEICEALQNDGWRASEED